MTDVHEFLHSSSDDVFAGFTQFTPKPTPYDLGHGLTLVETYAYLFAPHMMSFARPDDPGKHHPGPWASTTANPSHTILSELYVPKSVHPEIGTPGDIARTVLFLLRLSIDPSITLAALSKHSFSKVSVVSEQSRLLIPVEIEQRHFPLHSESLEDHLTLGLDWIKKFWEQTHRLRRNRTFELAMAAIQNGQFVENDALTLISLWAALESIFTPELGGEITFRLSSYMAAFLRPPGEQSDASSTDR